MGKDHFWTHPFEGNQLYRVQESIQMMEDVRNVRRRPQFSISWHSIRTLNVKKPPLYSGGFGAEQLLYTS